MPSKRINLVTPELKWKLSFSNRTVSKFYINEFSKAGKAMRPIIQSVG